MCGSEILETLKKILIAIGRFYSYWAFRVNHACAGI